MCGICGTFKATPAQNRLLLQLNESRGQDAVGVFISREGQTRRVRVPLSVTEAILNHRLPHSVFTTELFLGHTRAGTSGGNTRENTHPFQCGDLVGAHNGIFGNHYELRNKYKVKHPEIEKFAVDSHIAVWMINKFGPAVAIPQLKGYASMWWVNVETPHLVNLFVCHNELYVTLDAENGIPFAFSSDIRHLTLAGLSTANTFKISNTGTLVTIDLSLDVPAIISTDKIALNETQEHDPRTSGGSSDGTYLMGVRKSSYASRSSAMFPPTLPIMSRLGSGTPPTTATRHVSVDIDDEDDKEAEVTASAENAGLSSLGASIQRVDVPVNLTGSIQHLYTGMIHAKMWCCQGCKVVVPEEAVGYVLTASSDTRAPHCLLCGHPMQLGVPQYLLSDEPVLIPPRGED